MRSRTLSDARICRIIGSAIARDSQSIEPSMDLRRDLCIDSVGLMSIVYVLGEETGLDVFNHVEKFVNAEHVSDIIAIVQQAH